MNDKLSYSLAENQLTPDPTDYMAQVSTGASYNQANIIDEMMNRGSSLTRTDMEGVINLFNQTVAEKVANGQSINLPLFNGTPSISGVFTGPADTFDPARHYVRFNLSPGTMLRESVAKIKTEKTEPTDKLPYMEQFLDMGTNAANDLATPGGIGQLQGSRLSFDAADPEQGISFVAADGTETRVETIALNKPSKLIFMIPNLAPGTYGLVLRVKFRNTKSLREVRFRKSLTVVGETGAN